MNELVTGPSLLRCEFAERIASAWHKSQEKLFSLGRALAEAKEKLPHGEFLAMIKTDLPFGPDLAQMFMRISSDPKLINADTSKFLPSSATALDELRRLPDASFKQAIANKEIRPDMTVVEARALVRRETSSQAVESDGAGPEPQPDDDVEFPPMPARRSVVRVERPKNGVCLNYGQLVGELVARRTRLAMSQAATDHHAGWEEGYTGKLEQPNTTYGRRAVHESFDVWLGAMGVGLKIVPLDEIGEAPGRDTE
tara:strand:- start:345 stop:1106 length:762 start_codon:yes stop_codon:yes gene_type:complete